MALPTNAHDEVTDWLGRHGVRSYEIAFTIVTRDLDRLLTLVGSEELLTSGEREVLRRGRRVKRAGWEPSIRSDAEAVVAEVQEVLARVCALLARCGVTAEPRAGFGVLSGDEPFEGAVMFCDTRRLRELMAGRS